MAIIRTKQTSKFTVVNNQIFEVGGLSWDSRGLLCTLLSKPDDWSIIVKSLEKETEGTRKHTKERGLWEMLKELITAGYVIRKKRQSGEVDYFVHDTPQTAKSADCENRKLLKAQTAKSADCENVGVLLSTDNNNQDLIKDNQVLSREEANATPAPPSELVLLDGVPVKQKSNKPNQDNINTRKAYIKAYQQRYGVDPITDARFNGQVAQFVKKVGASEAPTLAAYYVTHNGSFFVQRRHDFGLLLNSAQQIRTDWARNEQMTATSARQTERQSGNMANAAALIAQYAEEAGA